MNVAIVIILIIASVLFMLFKKEDQHYIEKMVTGFDTYVYIYQIVKHPLFGKHKSYIKDGYTGSRRNFKYVELAKSHIDKLLTSETKTIIKHP